MADLSVTKELDELHKQARATRRMLEPDWFMNLAMMQGKQWLRWNGNQLHAPTLNGNRITLVENRIQGVIQTRLAKRTKNRPVFTVTPRTGDEMDANAASLAEQILRYLWKHLNLHEITFKAYEWAEVAGAGFLKVYWDSTVGPKTDLLIQADGKLLLDGQGGVVKHGTPEADLAMQMAPDQVKVKTVAQGDLRVEARSPFQMFIDPLADSFPEAEWVIEESIKSVEYVRQRYGVVLKADTPANPGLVEARMLGANLQGSTAYKGVKVREYWCKPGSKHPNGCRIVWAQNKVLLQDEKPFDPMPYVMISGIPIPGRLWPMSIVDHLRSPQTELNKVRSQMAENRNRVGNPTVLASRQAVQDPEKFVDATTLPGGVYFYDDIGSPNALPKYLEPPSLPDYVAEEPQLIRQAIEDISGQHEVTNAQVPPGVTAASAITLLQEADDTRLGPAITDQEIQLGRFGQKLLQHVAKFYNEARTIRVGGENGAWEYFDFRGAMLRDNTQVEVQAGSAFPQSKAAKQALIQDLMTFFVQSGNPPHGRQLAQFLRDSGMGGTDTLVQDYTRDEEQVNAENVRMSQGESFPPNDFDNDQAHIDGHTDFQKQQRYRMLPPQIQQIVEQHVAAHRQKVASEQQAQMQLQMQMQGNDPHAQAQQQQMDAAQQQQQMQMQAAQSQQQMAQQSQQSQLQAQQKQQQMDLQAQQSGQQHGFTAAQQEQQLRHAEDQHLMKLRQQAEQHNLQMRQEAEAHAEKLQQQARQAAQQRRQQQQGANSGRKAA